jgi:four helix bundle protein
MGKQLLRCGTSVAANYRAVCRARSKAEFVARMGIVAEEADESVLWLELLEETGILSHARLQDILKEATELVASFQRHLRQPRATDRRQGFNLPIYQITHLPIPLSSEVYRHMSPRRDS